MYITKDKLGGNITSTFNHLATFSEFEKLVVNRTEEYTGLNNIHEELHIKNQEWIATKNIRLYTIQESDFEKDELSITLNLSRSADYYQSFSLHFENCDKSVINKIQFICNNIYNTIDNITIKKLK